MSFNRRKFISLTALTAGTLGVSNRIFGANVNDVTNGANLPKAIRDLQPMMAGIVPIAKAQSLMAQEKMDAIFIEGTVSCYYFTGMRWGQSERTFGVVIPAKGDIAYICPKFEEGRARELILPVFGEEVRCWEEHESPYALILGIVKDRGVVHNRIGMEERVRFFIANGVKKLETGFDIVDATPINAGCRVIKSKA